MVSNDWLLQDTTVVFLTHSQRRRLLNAIKHEYRFVDENGDIRIGGLDDIRFRIQNS